MENAESIKNVVKEKYAAVVRQQNQGCCGPKSPQEFTEFSESYVDLQGYVKDADLHLGCGVPTEHAAMQSGDAVIDLGCGAGNDCFVARAIVGESGRVTGLDFTDEMLAKARQNAARLGFDNVDFVEGDIEDMPIADHSFDVAISNCVLNLVPDKQKAFSEIKRILRPGGHFCVSDIVLKGHLPDKIRETATLYAGCVSGALQMDDYLDIIAKNGFRNVEIKKERLIDVPDAVFLKHITPEELRDFRAMNTGIYSITVVAYT
jgi:arsenite methyltransferase